MTREIENLIRKSMAKDIQIKMLNRELEGFIVSKEIVLEILEELTKVDEFELEPTTAKERTWDSRKMN